MPQSSAALPLSHPVDQAWQVAYLAPGQSLALAQQVIAAGPEARASASDLAQAWLLVALAEVRVGDRQRAAQALAEAEAMCAAAHDMRVSGLSSEVRVMLLRRDGRHADALALLAELDAGPQPPWTDHDQFLRHNSRGISEALRGQAQAALRHFYTSLVAARASGVPGAVITALGNLGSHHLYLHNLEDARTLCEEALQASRAAGQLQMVVSAAVNLVTVYRLLGRHDDLQKVAEVLNQHPGAVAAHTHTGEALALATAALFQGDLATTRALLDQALGQSLHRGRQALYWVWLQARCWMAEEAAPVGPGQAAGAGKVAAARALIEQTLAARGQPEQVDSPQDVMELHAAAAEACERLGDLAAALDHTRRGHRVFQQLADQGARARLLALQVGHDLDQAKRERDEALRLQQRSEEQARRLEALNLELQARIDETAQLQVLLREQALRDPLTGLFNRRYLDEVVPGLLDLAARQQRPMAVAMLDLDHFKRLNDEFGHEAGDQVLERFASSLLQVVRRSDVVCRYGGEEFVLILPDSGGTQAELLLADVQQALDLAAPDPAATRLPRATFSAGVALFPAHGQRFASLLARADQALYDAKRQGRARVVQFSEAPSSA